MVEKGIKVDAFTFQVLMLTCKNSVPCQAAKAIRIFAEMTTMKVKPTRAHFNTAVGVCWKAREWRRALQIFKRMNACGVEANTAMYEILSSACATAPIEDAPAVYEAMKFTGVPEYFCYATSQKIIARHKGTLPTFDIFEEHRGLRRGPSRN